MFGILTDRQVGPGLFKLIVSQSIKENSEVTGLLDGVQSYNEIVKIITFPRFAHVDKRNTSLF